MEPSLFPDLAHLPAFIATCVVAVCCIGLGVWTGARRVETALIAGWGMACFVTVVAGTLTGIGLSWVMLGLAAAAVAGLARLAITMRHGTSLLETSLAGKVALLALPLAACIEGIETIGWDDFSHWLPNLSYVCEHNHYPTLAQPALSDHAGYPYGLALPGFAVFLMLGRVPDDAAIYWNVIVMLAAAASIARILAERLAADWLQRDITGWSCAAIGLLSGGLASPAFVPKIFFSNMADAATGAVVAVLGSMIFEWIAAHGKHRDRIAIAFAAGCVVLVDLRQANAALFGLLIVGCLVMRWRHDDQAWPRALPALAIAAIPAILVYWLWGRYVIIQIPGGQLPILPFSEWRWASFPEALHNMLRVMVAKTGLFTLILLVFVRAALSFRQRDDLGPPARGTLIVSAIVCVGMIFFLAFTYLSVGFLPSESAAAASFWRYMGEVGPLAAVGAAACIPLAWVRWVRRVPAMVALVSVTSLLPLVTVKFYRADLTSPVAALRSEGSALKAAMPRTASLLLVDLTGNGFAPLVVTYELMISGNEFGLPARRVTQVSRAEGISAATAANIDFTGPDYIWLAEGAPEMVRIFGVKLSAGCSYLLKRESTTYSVVTSWRIGHYKWTTYRDGWSGAAEGSCG
jgi:hypothetical protein